MSEVLSVIESTELIINENGRIITPVKIKRQGE
jgi:hypothetical protein